jgi:hypothetical protein
MAVQVVQPKRDEDNQTMGILAGAGSTMLSSKMGGGGESKGPDKPKENAHLEAARRQLAKQEEENRKSMAASQYKGAV